MVLYYLAMTLWFAGIVLTTVLLIDAILARIATRWPQEDK